MDGHQAAKAIRTLGIERSDAVTIPIIALSANAFIDDIQESLDLGMNAHISKPINMEELIDTITKYKQSIPQSNHSVSKRENEIVGGEPDEGEEPPEKKPRDLER